MTHTKPVRDLSALLYDIRMNLMSAKRDLVEAAEKDFATADNELTPIIDLVEESIMRLKLVGNKGAWLC